MCRRILHPLVRMLIRFGISAGELKAIVDSVYAHAGSEHLAAQGERVTYSRLAVITGINRSFLPDILATPQDEFRPRSQTQLHRAARVLNGWYDDVGFQTRTGEPAVLSVSGRRRSFEQLAHRYSGGVYYPNLLAELLRVGAVKMVGTRRVRALRRAPALGGPSADAVYSAGEITGDLLATLDHNLAAPPHEQLPVRALALRVDAHSVSLFRAQLAKRADGLLEMTDAFLQAHKSSAPPPPVPGSPETPLTAATDAETKEITDLILGAGVFAICKPASAAETHLTGNKPSRPSKKKRRPKKKR
jgi:hypothetical protein